METEESVLKDAISADIKSFSPFNPVGTESMVAFHGGIDGSQSLFDFIIQFDAQFKAKNIETAELFIPIIEELLTLRGNRQSHNDKGLLTDQKSAGSPYFWPFSVLIHREGPFPLYQR